MKIKADGIGEVRGFVQCASATEPILMALLLLLLLCRTAVAKGPDTLNRDLRWGNIAIFK